MSYQEMASITDGTGKCTQSLQASQPVWMAHWTRSRGTNVINGSRDSRPIKESKVVETKGSEIANSKGKESRTTCWPLMKNPPIVDDEQTPRGVFCLRDIAADCNGGTPSSFGVPVVNETPFGRWESASEGTSKSIPEWMNTHLPATDSSIPALKPFHGPIMESPTHTVPYYDLKKCEFDTGKSPLIMKSCIVAKDQFPDLNMRTIQQEQCHKHDTGADLFLKPVMHGCLRDINTSVLFDAVSTSCHHLLALVPENFLQLQNHPICEMFPDQHIFSKKTESKKPCCSSYPRQNLPYCVLDTKTKRICTTVDSAESIPDGFPRFSQTTHKVLITKSVDVLKENLLLPTTQFSTKTRGNTPTNILCQSPLSGQANRGVDFHSLSSSSISKGKRKIEDTIASKLRIKNEPSAETDAMDIYLFKEKNSNSGANHNPSIKSVNIGSTSSPLMDSTSCGEPKQSWRMTMPLDLNLEAPALPASPSSSPNTCTTSSRAPCFDMNMDILPLQNNSKEDTTMSWVKRLKPRSSGSFMQDTQSSNLGKGAGDLCKIILKTNVTVSVPNPKSHQVNEELIANSSNKGNESVRSQAWIKRWLQNRSEVTEKKSTEIICEPQNFKSVLDDFQKKKLPSIAAMALMGKAMNGLQSCELKKQESLTIWNTKAF